MSGEELRARVFQPLMEMLRGRGHLAWDSVAPFADAAFRAVFDSSAEALLVVNAAGVVQRANHRAREVLHLREANLSHSTLDSYLPAVSPQRLSKLGAEDALPLPPMIEAELTGGSPVRVTLRAVLPGSGDILLCVNSQGGQGQAQTAETEFRAVVESVQAGILLLDPAGGVKFASARFAEIFGLRKPEIDRAVHFRELHGFLAGRLRNPVAFAAPWNAFASGAIQPQKDELEVIEPSGRIVERLSRPVLDSQGRPAGWLELYTDVTIERSIQKKILQSEKMAALGQFVSGIAHELNNPLTTIMGYAQLLSGHALSPAQLLEARSKVYQEAERARRIVKSLLYFARENQPQRVLVELNEIVERALALRSYDLRVRNIAVVCELGPDLPATMADPFQLQQVLLNLLVNAEQALIEGRGHGEVRIRTRTAERQDGKRLILEVADDGPGISSEIGSRIFDPFFTTKPPGVGTGLGLSIVYGIVRQHGGEVSYESIPGAGTKFMIELPVVAAAKASAQQVAATTEKPLQAKLTGRILVVEDEPSVAHLLADILNEEGHQVEAVLESPEGLARLARANYDLVICDLRMPLLDGRKFYEALVNSGSPASRRLLFITGDTMARSTQEFLETTGMPYLAKPFLVEEVKLAVRRCLEAHAEQVEQVEQEPSLPEVDVRSPGGRS